jgi:hypothetical protein
MLVVGAAEPAAAPGLRNCAGETAVSGSSASFMPAWKALMPLAKSGQLPGAKQNNDNGQDHNPMNQAERTHNNEPRRVTETPSREL